MGREGGDEGRVEMKGGIGGKGVGSREGRRRKS